MKKTSKDVSKAACSKVENYTIKISVFGVLERQPSILVIHTFYFLQVSSTKKEENEREEIRQKL